MPKQSSPLIRIRFLKQYCFTFLPIIKQYNWFLLCPFITLKHNWHSSLEGSRRQNHLRFGTRVEKLLFWFCFGLLHYWQRFEPSVLHAHWHLSGMEDVMWKMDSSEIKQPWMCVVLNCCSGSPLSLELFLALPVSRLQSSLEGLVSLVWQLPSEIAAKYNATVKQN